MFTISATFDQDPNHIDFINKTDSEIPNVLWRMSAKLGTRLRNSSMVGVLNIYAAVVLWWRHDMELFAALQALSEGNHRGIHFATKGQ